MSILNNNTINNIVNNKWIRKNASTLCAGGISSVVLLESTVMAGRTYQAKKRGGDIEARERFTEESISAVIWIWGMEYVNKGFDLLINKVGKIKAKTGIKDFGYDSGSDNIRKPFEYVTQNIKNESTKKKIAALKFSKIVASAAICVGFMGMVLPKLNQKITKNMLDKRNKENGNTSPAPIKIESKKTNRLDINDFLVMSRGSAGDPNMASSRQARKLDINESLTMSKGSAGDPKMATSRQARKLDINESLTMSKGSAGDPKMATSRQAQNLDTNESLTMSKGSAGDPNFQGGSFFEIAAQQLENNPTTQLLTIDGGLFTGRAVNARNKYERNEILFRDLSSTFFYMFSTKYIVKALCALDGLKGKNSQLTPEIAHQLHEKMDTAFATSKDSISKEEFEAKVFGQRYKEVSDDTFKKAGKLFNSGVTTVDKMHKFLDENITDKTRAAKLKEKATKLSALQPQKGNVGQLTKSQLTNLFHNGLLNEPEFINKIINDATKGKAMNPIKFIAQSTIDEHRDGINDYARSILTQADKEKTTSISKDLLTRMKNRNFITKMGYWGVGMAISGLFLSTIIPKVQYLMTQKATGSNNFPGVQTYEKVKK